MNLRKLGVLPVKSATAGPLIGKGGSIGIAGLGTKESEPWFVAGAVLGLAVYGGYKAMKSDKKN